MKTEGLFKIYRNHSISTLSCFFGLQLIQETQSSWLTAQQNKILAGNISANCSICLALSLSNVVDICTYVSHYAHIPHK